MFKALFNIIIDMLATVVQIICWPVNQVITNALPDLSSKISEVSSALSTMFNSISWAIGIVPDPIIDTLLFIFSVEIIRHSIYIGTKAIIKIWPIIQKIKFW